MTERAYSFTILEILFFIFNFILLLIYYKNKLYNI